VNWLAGIDKLVADVAGPLLFERASLLRAGSYTIDPATGQTVFASPRTDIKAIEQDYKAIHRASMGIPAEQRKIAVIGYGLAMPEPGDQIALRGVLWEITEAERDPAGALYNCHSVPVGIDPEEEPEQALNALSSVSGIVYQITAERLFNEAYVYRNTGGTIDANGQSSSILAPEAARAFETDYSAFHRGAASIPLKHRKLLVLGEGLSGALIAGDKIDLDGTRWEAIAVSRDPAGAIYICECRPIGDAVVFRVITHTGILARIQGVAVAEVSQAITAIHQGTLANIQGTAEAAAIISAVHSGQLAAIRGSAIIGAETIASHAGVLSRVALEAFAQVSVAAAHAGSLARVSLEAAASVGVTASHAGTLAPISGTAEASSFSGITASHFGTLSKIDGEATAESIIAASHAGSLAPISGMANAEAGTGAQHAGSLAGIQGSATAETLITAQSEGILAGISGTASADVAITAAHAGILAAISGVAEASPGASASHAGTLASIAGTAAASTLIAASHTGTLARLQGSASANAIIAATHTGTLAAITGTAEAEVSGGATSRTMPVFQSETGMAFDTSFAKPSGTSEGDFLVAVLVSYYSAASNFTIPSGWTAFGATLRATDTVCAQIIYKFAGASEPSSWSFSATGSGALASHCLRYTNVDPSEPMAALSSVSTGTGTVRTVPGITLPYDNSKLMAFTASFDSYLSAPPSSMTERSNVFNVNGVYDQDYATAGATGSRTQAQDNTADWLAVAFALNGAP
jgi:hypothetical protein